MATAPSTPTVIKIAQISEYLASRDISSNRFYNQKRVNTTLPQLLYITRKDVEWIYALNSSDPALPVTTAYLYALCAPYSQEALTRLNAQTAQPPAVSGPSNQTVNVGQNAVFSVSVTSTLPVTYQWLLNGNPISGATGASYPITSAQLSQSGGEYSVVVSNAVGSVTSSHGLLTVNANIVANWWFGPSDPYPALSGGSDTLVYQVSQNIAHDSEISITYPSGAENNEFNVLRYPDTETDKTIWINTVLNQGTIPDAVMRAILHVAPYKYIVSRNAMSLDATATTLTYQ